MSGKRGEGGKGSGDGDTDGGRGTGDGGRRAHLHICLETWLSRREEGRIAAADADIIAVIKD